MNSQHNGPVYVDSVTVSREESEDGVSEFDAFGGIGIAFPSTWRLDLRSEMGSEASGTWDLSRPRTACGCRDYTLPRQLIKIQPHLGTSMRPLFHLSL